MLTSLGRRVQCEQVAHRVLILGAATAGGRAAAARRAGRAAAARSSDASSAPATASYVAWSGRGAPSRRHRPRPQLAHHLLPAPRPCRRRHRDSAGSMTKPAVFSALVVAGDAVAGEHRVRSGHRGGARRGVCGGAGRGARVAPVRGRGLGRERGRPERTRPAQTPSARASPDATAGPQQRRVLHDGRQPRERAYGCRVQKLYRGSGGKIQPLRRT